MAYEAAPLKYMESKYHYSPDEKMAKLIADHYRLIHVMSRFGIPVGFGDKTVRQVCDEYGVDCHTFLSVVTFIIDGYFHADQAGHISVSSLMHWLQESHIYFLDYLLPAIRRKLLDSISMRADSVSLLIIRFFDEYTSQVRRHMEYEERTVFAYVSSLLNNQPVDGYSIHTYSDHHEEVASSLRELKSIIIKYGPAESDANRLNDALYDIYRCEEELNSHCLVEDEMLVPAIMKLEKEAAMSGSSE